MTNPKKVGLVFGTVLGGVHVLWSLFVLFGIAQALVTFSLWAHMVHVDVAIGPFDAMAAITVIIIAACIGYVVGYIGGTVWNRVHR